MSLCPALQSRADGHHPVTLLSWKFSVGPSCCALTSWQPGRSSHREPWCLRLAWAGLDQIGMAKNGLETSGGPWTSPLLRAGAALKINQALQRFFSLALFFHQAFKQGEAALIFTKNVPLLRSFQGICDSSSPSLSQSSGS